MKVALGAGLGQQDADALLEDSPRQLLSKLRLSPTV
jgi:hypothetical protein